MERFRLETLKQFAEAYHDLNGTHLETLDEPPTALELSRLVHISRPVIIKGFDVRATSRLWTDEYLTETMGDTEISVAVTPNGAADAITPGENGEPYFAESHVEKMTMGNLMSKLNDRSAQEVHYLQSQNGNVYSARYFEVEDDPSEFDALRKDIPCEVRCCSEALDRQPHAVNLWIGNGRSVTSLHNDPYENVYTVVRGKKVFTLLSPVDGWCLQERLYPHATYTRSPSGVLELVPSPPDVPPVRWSSIEDTKDLPPDAHPFKVTLEEGMALYLPAGWWHHVRQATDELTIALNWWYDMEMRGTSWVLLNFLRGGELVPSANAKDEEK